MHRGRTGGVDVGDSEINIPAIASCLPIPGLLIGYSTLWAGSIRTHNTTYFFVIHLRKPYRSPSQGPTTLRMASGIPNITMGPQGWQLAEKRKNGRPNKVQQMRADAIAMGLLPGSSVSHLSTATPIPLRNGRTLESDDACTRTQSIRPTIEDARLYSAPTDVLLSQNRNITPTVHDDSRPVTQVPGISTQRC